MDRRVFMLVACLALLGLANVAEAGRLHAVESAAVRGLRSLDPTTGRLATTGSGPALDPETGVIHHLGRMAATGVRRGDGVAALRWAEDYARPATAPVTERREIAPVGHPVPVFPVPVHVLVQPLEGVGDGVHRQYFRLLSQPV